MKLTVLGVGGAGCRLVARLRERETDERPYLAGVRAFDTDPTTFETLDLPAECCRAFSPSGVRSRDSTSETADAANPDDADAASPATASDGPAENLDRAGIGAVRAGAEASVAELRRVASDAISGETDGVLVVAGLGGATGAGAAPVIVDALRDIHDLPTYALSVLPHKDEDEGEDGVEEEAESDGDRAAANAAAGLRAFEGTVDSQLCFDNDALSKVTERPAHPQDALDVYDDLNTQIARWVSVLFDAGEASTEAEVGERVLDVSELAATLGERGYTMLGYRREQVTTDRSFVDRLLSRGSDDEVDTVERYSTIETMVRRALLRHRSFDADADLARTERALLVAVGPPEWLDREALADGRRLLTRETDGAVVRGADAPDPEGTDLQVLVVCAGIDRPERVRALLEAM